MKLQIDQSIKQGLKVIIKNPIILALTIIYAVSWCIYSYLFIYAPGLIEIAPEHFRLYTILFTLVPIFFASVIIKMVYDAVIKNNVSVSDAINLSLRKFVFIFIATILYLLIGGIGLIVLIIPGIFLMTKLFFFDCAILLDNKGIISSFEKSWQITKGNWWEVFGFQLIFLIPIIILSLTASAIAPNSVQIALVLDFVWLLLWSWLISAFTIAYIQLTQQDDKEIITEAQ